MFKELNEMIAVGQSVTITIYKTPANMTVSIIPKDSSVKDDAAGKIKPLEVTGTAEELDEGFINAISSPLQKSSGLLTNISEYEKGLAEAAVNSKEGKEKTEKAKKVITEAEKLDQEKKMNEALEKYKEALEIDPTNRTAAKRISEIEKELKQPSLF